MCRLQSDISMKKLIFKYKFSNKLILMNKVFSAHLVFKLAAFSMYGFKEFQGKGNQLLYNNYK